ncbi:MAG: T9SS type A sorting domain-containing protein [Chitinophagaceae bacterium]|nr:MAG: T9SS type A sorting domain-containing protein [Chitinophagaceae bacterium]
MVFHMTVNPCGPVTLHGDTQGDGSNARTAARMTLSPNPAGSNVQVTYSGSAKSLTVEVRNAYGQPVLAARAFSGTSVTLNSATLAPGTYYVVLTDRVGGTRTQQLLVKL